MTKKKLPANPEPPSSPSSPPLPPLTAADLDKMGCGVPDCGHDHSILYLHSRCHLRAGSSVRYEKKSGLIIVDCKVCGKEVARVAVAES